MEYDVNKLRGKIIEKFGSQQRFAEHMKMAPNTVSRKLNADIGFSREEILEWCDALDIKTKDIGAYFFTNKV